MSLFNFNIFKRDDNTKENQFYTSAPTALPANFAQNLLELEMRVEFQDSCNLQVIRQLSDLYRVAIEHYINEDPKKAQHFQRKLANLLANPASLQAMSNPSPNPTKKQSAKQVLTNNSVTNLSMNLKLELGKFSNQAQGIVKSMIERTQENAAKTDRMVRDNLWRQQESLKQRLQERSLSRRRVKHN